MIKLWVITGDIHGSASRFEEYEYPRDGTTGVIILGDAGVNYYMNNRDTSVKKKLQNSGFEFYLVRGNHEARPEDCEGVIWDYDKNVEGTVGIDVAFPAIHYLQDGGIYFFNGHRTLIIGGAYSIDKYYRLQKGYPYQWFENEQLSPEEREEIYNKVKGQEFDFVFTHTCPRAWEPVDLFLPSLNQATIDKSMENWLDDIKIAIKYKVWLFGHFHADRIEKWNVEQFFQNTDELENIWERWNNIDIKVAKKWWLEKSPLSEL